MIANTHTITFSDDYEARLRYYMSTNGILSVPSALRLLIDSHWQDKDKESELINNETLSVLGKQLNLNARGSEVKSWYVDYLNNVLFNYQSPLIKNGAYYYNSSCVAYFCGVNLANVDSSGVRIIENVVIKELFSEASRLSLKPVIGICCLRDSDCLIHGLFDPRELPTVIYSTYHRPDRSICCYSNINKEFGTVRIVLKLKHSRCMSVLRSLTEISFPGKSKLIYQD